MDKIREEESESLYIEANIIFNTYKLSKDKNKDKTEERIFNIIHTTEFKELEPLLLYFYHRLEKENKSSEELAKKPENIQEDIFKLLLIDTSEKAESITRDYNKTVERYKEKQEEAQEIEEPTKEAEA